MPCRRRRCRISISAGAMLLLCAVAGMGVAKPPSPKACLADAAKEGKPLPAVVYSDAHGLWGGTTISLGAGGAYRRDRVDPQGPSERIETLVEASRHRALVALLVELKAWKQQVPERRAVPDESRAGLMIRARNRGTSWDLPEVNRTTCPGMQFCSATSVVNIHVSRFASVICAHTRKTSSPRKRLRAGLQQTVNMPWFEALSAVFSEG